MSTEKLIKGLATQIDRRKFLGKLAVSVLGAVTAALGLSQTAAAVDYACCHLCFAPSGRCPNCACTWCWVCTDLGTVIKCCECHTVAGTCGSKNCTSVNCSWVEFVAAPAQ